MKGRKRKPLQAKEDDPYEESQRRSKKSSGDSLLSVVLAKAESQSLRLEENQNGNQIKIHCNESTSKDSRLRFGLSKLYQSFQKLANLPTEVLWNQTFIPTNQDETHLPEGFMAQHFHDTFDWDIYGLDSYEHRIFQEQYQLEQQFRVNHASYLRQHPGFVSHRRAGLVDFMVTLCRRLELDAHCVCKSVNLLDRFLSQIEHVFPKEITAIGVASVMIVMKYECCCNFPLDELCKMICPDDFTSFKSIVIAMEYRILTSIDWQLHAPTSTMFLRRYYRIVPLTCNLQYRVAQCCCERVLLEPMLALQFTPSVIAATCAIMAASVNTATDTIHYTWNENMENYTHYTAERDIIPCITRIQAVLQQETTQRALRYVKQQQTLIMQVTIEYFEFSWYERVVHWCQQEMAEKEVLLSTMRTRSTYGEEQLEKLRQRQVYLSYLPSILEAAARKRLRLPQCGQQQPMQSAYYSQRGMFSPMPASHNNFLLSAASTSANADDSMASGITDCALETSLLSTPSTKEDSPATAAAAAAARVEQSEMYEIYDIIDTMLRETKVEEVMHDAIMIRYPDVYSYLVTYPPSK